MKGMRFFWGIILLVLGVLFLGTNVGWWSNAVWISFLSFWPIVLIVLGLRILIKNNGLFSILALMVVAVSLVLSIYWPGVVLNEWHWSDSSIKATSDSASQIYDKNSIKSLDLNLSSGAGKILLGELNQGTQKLFEETNTNMGPINKSVNVDGDKILVKLSSQKMSYFLVNPGRWGNREQTTKITPDLPLKLVVSSGASSFNFDFSKLKLYNLEVNAGASSGKMKFGLPESSIKTKIDMGASNLEISLPKELAFKVKVDSGLTKITFSDSSGISQSDDLYVSKDYDSAKKKIEIELVSGASNIKINFN